MGQHFTLISFTNINWFCLSRGGVLFLFSFLSCSLLGTVWTHGRTGLLLLHWTLLFLQLDEATVHAIHTWHLLLQHSSLLLMYPSTPMPCAKHHCSVHLFKDTKHLIDIRQSENPLDTDACKTTSSFKLVTDQQLVVWQRRYIWMVKQKSVSCALVQFLWLIISNWDQHRQASKLLNMWKIIQIIQNKLINSHTTLLLW